MGDATESILITIKKMLGIAQEYNAFDVDIIVNINSVFLSLNQLGVGPATPYHLSSDSQTWSDFLGDQKSILEGVQTYTYLKVRLLFDPPTNSFVVTAMQEQCKELEWRLNAQVERETFDLTPIGPSQPIEPEEPEEPDEPNEDETEYLRSAWKVVTKDV